MEKKIWKVRNKNDKYTDEELVEAIKSGKISKDDYIATRDMKTYLQVKKSIYQFYLKEETNEII